MKILKLLLVILLIICSFFAGLKYNEFKTSVESVSNEAIDETIMNNQDVTTPSQNEEDISISDEENIEDAQIIDDMINSGENREIVIDENNASFENDQNSNTPIVPIVPVENEQETVIQDQQPTDINNQPEQVNDQQFESNLNGQQEPVQNFQEQPQQPIDITNQVEQTNGQQESTGSIQLQ